MNVDALLDQAFKLYSAGYAKSALAEALKALACRQHPRMYRFVATYACAARALAIAKLYFTKVAAEVQPNIEQRCQQEGLSLRGP